MKKLKSILILAVMFVVLALPHVADAAGEPFFVNLLNSCPYSAKYITQIKKISAEDATGEFVRNNADKTITVYITTPSAPGEITEVWHLDENDMVSSITVKGYTGKSHYVSYEGDNVIVYEGWQSGKEYKIFENGRYMYNRFLFLPRTSSYEYDNLGRIISFSGLFLGIYRKTQIEYYDSPSVSKVYSFDVKNISNPTKPKEGKANVNQVQWTGDVFEFTAITAPEVNSISLLADKFEGKEWHEITYDYLQKKYYLEAHINSNNQKVWTCRFGIHNVGNRIFKLKVDGVETDAKTNVNVTMEAYNTNIYVYINGQAIPSFALGGRSVVVAEDLRKYGFDVIWNNDTRTLDISRNVWGVISPITFTKTEPSGSFFSSVFESDIKVNLNGQRLTSFAINGYTLVPIEEFAMFYNVQYDDAERALKLTF